MYFDFGVSVVQSYFSMKIERLNLNKFAIVITLRLNSTNCNVRVDSKYEDKNRIQCFTY